MSRDLNDFVVLVDIDDVLENLCEEWCNLLNIKYGTSVSYTDVTDWDISQFFPNLTREQVFEPLHNDMIWVNLKPKDGAVEYLKKLIDDGFDVYLCTSTDYRNVKVKFEKVIQRYFPFISWNKVIVASKKQMIKADVLIDDGTHNLIGGDYYGILMSAPHNRTQDLCKYMNIFRANNWKEAYRLVKDLYSTINNRKE